MRNYFDIWNKIKQSLDQKNPRAFPKKRETWLINIGNNIGNNIGFEIDGKTNRFWRPVLVLKKLSKNICLIIPLTTKEKKGPFCMKMDKKSFVLFDQIRIVDRRRFIHKISKIELEIFKLIISKYKKYLFGEAFSVEPTNVGNEIF